MKKRPDGQDPFMPPPEFGRSLTGFTLNILVRNIERAVELHRDVFLMNVLYADPDIGIVESNGVRWMIHADHTYDKHPLHGYIGNTEVRGVGAEFRIHGLNPDSAEIRAREHGFKILNPTRDQPDHGLREVHIIDDEGYIWAVDEPLPPDD